MNKSFHIPAGKGDLDIVKTELDEGRDIDSRDAAGQTALMYAADTGQMEVVKYLVTNGADVNAQSKGFGRGTALIYAAASNRLEIMEYLIERGANVNAMTGNKETALFWAAAQGHIDAIKILLKNGADTELKNKKDQTALDVAKELNRNKVIELLKN
jgi:ankyrin repeat protein